MIYRSMEVDTRKASTHWKDPSISKLLAIITSGVFGFFNPISCQTCSLTRTYSVQLEATFISWFCVFIVWMFGKLGSFSVGQVLGWVVLLAQRHWERPKRVGRGTHEDNFGKSAYCTILYISENVHYHKL